MSKDRVIGISIFLGSTAGIVVYGWLMFLTEYAVILLQLSAFIAVATVLAIAAWVGYTFASTRPPRPMEELGKEIEKVEMTEKNAREKG